MRHSATAVQPDLFTTLEPAQSAHVASARLAPAARPAEVPAAGESTDPLLILMRRIEDLLGSGESIPDNRALTAIARDVFGGSRAAGAYGSRDAYDALEAAVNAHVARRAPLLAGLPPEEALAELERLLARLPRQADRTAEQVLLQQFSTPPTIAFLVWMALASPGPEEMLEPSAGTGSLAVWPSAAGAAVHTNEISPRRRLFLEALGYAPTAVDAELLDDLLPREIRPSAILMNPPFSSTGGRVANNRALFGARHIEHALRRLRAGGRLVTVIGEGVGRLGEPVLKWWRYVSAKYTVRANLALPPGVYAKYGTSYRTHLLVIDKVAPDAAETEAAFRWRAAATLEEAAAMISALPARAEIPEASAAPPAAPKVGCPAPVAARPKLVLAPAALAPSACEEPEEDLPETGPFVRYTPRPFPGSVPHPARLVETASMAAVEPPEVSYRPALPEDVVLEGRLSEVQLERVVFAGARHAQRLPSGHIAGYFLGDGTGIGKGRTLAGVIYDNFLQGRRRALWLSVSNTLMTAAAEDLAALGASIPLRQINDTPTDADLPEFDGVVFSTYSSLIAQSKAGRRRLEQLLAWLGPEPVIVIDECHKAKNAVPSGSLSEPTQTGLAVIELQERIPEARVVYSSATGATEIRNMAYATRLGIWGPGTPFPEGFAAFLAEVSQGGVAALEMVSRDLKALGIYHSASISFAGVRFREAIHALTDEQREIYDCAARACQLVLRHFDEAIDITNASRRAANAARRAYWSTHQRLFKSIITALKLPTAVAEIERALAEGKSAIVSLIGTGEARTREQVSRAIAEGTDLDALNFAPDALLKQLVKKAYPVVAHQEATDEKGNTIRRPVLDAEGKPVLSAEAVRRRDELLDELDRLVIPENPLDQLINHFGAENVAELTGRSKRLVRTESGRVEYRKRLEDVAAHRINEAEMRAFQSGRKRVAIISAAASTGISLHASREAANRQPRVHFTLELGWSADAQVQTFGRSHRANQAHPPEYCLISTELGGERRFSSTIAKRLESLGAITKGQRDAAGADTIAKYNVESSYGCAALELLYSLLEKGRTREGLGSPLKVLVDMGLIREGDAEHATVDDEDRRDVPRFLNRVLALDCVRQNVLFDWFFALFEDAVEKAKANGTFDTGVVDVKGISVTLKREPQVVHTDKTTGAKTIHYVLNVKEQTNPSSWQAVERVRLRSEEAPEVAAAGYYLQTKSGTLLYAEPWRFDTDPLAGSVTRTYRGHRPSGPLPYLLTEAQLAAKYRRLTPAEAMPLWESAYARDPGHRDREIHVVAGAILPIWHLLRSRSEDALQIVRVETDDGRRIVGVRIPSARVDHVLRALGIGVARRSAAEIFAAALELGQRTELATGLAVRRTRLGGEDAVEIAGAPYTIYGELRAMGLVNETVNFVQRFFVPTDPEAGVPVLARVIERFPPID